MAREAIPLYRFHLLSTIGNKAYVGGAVVGRLFHGRVGKSRRTARERSHKAAASGLPMGFVSRTVYIR